VAVWQRGTRAGHKKSAGRRPGRLSILMLVPSA